MRSAEAGFTLIEVLVALVIAALGLGALMAAVSQGLGNAGAADRFIEGTRRAQSRLAMVGTTGPIVSGVFGGDEGDGYSWRVEIAPLASRAEAPPPQGLPGVAPAGTQSQAVTLYGVGVTISWRAGAGTKIVAIRSERLARAPAPAAAQ